MKPDSRICAWAILATALVFATQGCPSTPERQAERQSVSVEPADKGAVSAETQQSPRSVIDESVKYFQATLRIDEKPGGKRFQGVWLERSGGSRLLVDYRAREFWRPFEGRRVEVTGESYTPRGQAIMADHFRVAHIRVADIDYKQPSDADIGLELVELWGEKVYTGTFTVEEVPPGRKLSGTKVTWFVTEAGERFLLYDQRSEVPLDKAVTIEARRVEPTPFIARLGGPYLWIVDIR